MRRRWNLSSSPAARAANASTPINSGMSGLGERAATSRRVVAVCTSTYILAATGLLDGRRVTTHWRFAADLARRQPALRIEPKKLFLREGRLATSGGLSAGIDLALALHVVAQRFGAKVAPQTTTFMAYQGTGWKTHKGISPLTVPLRYEARRHAGSRAGCRLSHPRAPGEPPIRDARNSAMAPPCSTGAPRLAWRQCRFQLPRRRSSDPLRRTGHLTGNHQRHSDPSRTAISARLAQGEDELTAPAASPNACLFKAND